MADEAALNEQIAAQGGKVRELKTGGADKDAVTAAVKELLALKAKYKEVTGKDHGPPKSDKKKKSKKGKGGAAPAPAPAPAPKKAAKKAAPPPKAPPAAKASKGGSGGGKSIETTPDNAGPLDGRFQLAATGKFAVIQGD